MLPLDQLADRKASDSTFRRSRSTRRHVRDRVASLLPSLSMGVCSSSKPIAPEFEIAPASSLAMSVIQTACPPFCPVRASGFECDSGVGGLVNWRITFSVASIAGGTAMTKVRKLRRNKKRHRHVRFWRWGRFVHSSILPYSGGS